MMAIAPQTPRLAARLGANVVASVGLTLVAVRLGGMALFQTDSPYAQVITTIVVLAAGMAVTMSPMTNQLMSAVLVLAAAFAISGSCCRPIATTLT